MRVILYARVSTSEQADTGVSLDAQQAKLVLFAELHDLDVVERIVDAGQSAKSLNRAGLQRALAMLRDGQADGLVIGKLDRLSRNVADFQTLIEGYFGEKAGKQLFSVADSIDTRTAAGRLVVNILMSVSAWERESTSERTRDCLRHKIRNRQRVGAVRFGFTLADDKITLLPNAAEQAAIGTMRELKAAGLSLRKIAAELSARGIGTKQGLADWTHTAVSYILKQDRAAA